MLVFLGAGASLSSGMPSATQCIWEWKRSIFLTNNPGLEQQFSELSLPSVRERIQDWLDKQRRFPRSESADEYAVYIEECFNRSEDRRRFFERWVRSSKPHFGYQLLAELAKRNLVAAVWTTNFDGLVARAATSIGVPTIEVGIDTQHRVGRPLGAGELQHVSMHGDYRYDKLKNTSDELREQEAELRAALVAKLRSHPVLVCGYSGRDESLMSAFLEAYTTGTHQHPLYWTQYGDSDPGSEAAQLLDTRPGLEPQRYLVGGVSFDELMRRVALHVMGTNGRERIDAILERFKDSPVNRRSGFTLPSLPVTGLIKSNAFPIIPPGELLEFELVNWPKKGEVYSTLRAIGEQRGFVTAPFRGKVYAIATLRQITDAFSGNLVQDPKRVPISDEDLRYEDGTGNQLMRRAAVIALANKANLPSDLNSVIWDESESTVQTAESRNWVVHRAVLLQAKSVSNSFVLVMKPTLRVVDDAGCEAPKEVANAIKVRVLGYQHNREFNEELKFWTRRLLPDPEVSLRYPDQEDGIRFSIVRRPLLAKITDERESTVRLDQKLERRASQIGLQVTEPRLTFLSKAGRGPSEDTHPIRGLLQGRPFDAMLTESGISHGIRAAVICPLRDKRRVIQFLSLLHQSAEPTRYDEGYLLPFPGFSAAFKCSLEISQGGAGFAALEEPVDSSPESARELALRIASAIASLKASVNPSVTFIYIPTRWGPLRSFETGIEQFDLHDFIKAAAIPQGCATQLLEEDTLSQKQQCRVRWWLSLATYAKSMRSPWALRGLDKESAYVGIGYSLRHRPGKEGNVVLGCSHLYSPNGLGLQFRLSKLENPVMRRKNPFMSFDDARRLGEGIRELFFEAHLRLPKRVVVHKQTPFLKAEREGLQAGLEGIECVDLLQIHIDDTLRYVASKPNSKGDLEPHGYPIHRGTTVVVDEFTALLWVHGASTALDARKTYYQGKRRIPAPLVLTRHAGTSELLTLAEEILGLSKMNFNSFDLYGRLPATIETSRRVAKIGALLDRYADRTYDYRLFM